MLRHGAGGRGVFEQAQSHRRGFAHGNLRPSNILVNAADQPVLIDFETCCSRRNPLFFLARFNDQVRMRLLWQRRVAPYLDDQTKIEWPGYLTAVTLVITALNWLARPIKAAKKRWKMSCKRPRCGD
jgi:serine/threonine protein kinase